MAPTVLLPDPTPFLSGDRLYGDDFNAQQLREWLADEQEAYADLKTTSAVSYEYHALNSYHGYRRLAPAPLTHVLGFGSAHADELLPIADRIQRLTVVEPSNQFASSNLHGIAPTRVAPRPNGELPMENGTFDLITCFGVLHHIANVSFVVQELARTLKSGGQMLLREPIVSMGDWRFPRPGLTKHERGIPLRLLRSIVQRAGLQIRHEALCEFPVTLLLSRKSGFCVFNNSLVTACDALLCAAFAWNINYHPRTAAQKLRPTSAFMVLAKPL